MVKKLVQKPLYRMIFGLNGPIPLLDTQMIFEEDIVEFFQAHALMREEIVKKPQKTRFGIAEKITTTHSETGSSQLDQKSDKVTFDISYQNPVTKEIETIHAKTETISTDISSPIDTMLKTGSTYSIYNYITTPIYTEKIDPYIMEEIRKKIKIVPPKPFGGGVVIPIIKISKKIRSKAVAKKVEEARLALIEVMARERWVEKKLQRRIIVLEDAVKALRKRTQLKKVLDKLPRRMRALLLIRLKNKKKVTNKIVELLLLEDIGFLKELKIKLGKMGLKKLMALAQAIKKLTEKK